MLVASKYKYSAIFAVTVIIMGYLQYLHLRQPGTVEVQLVTPANNAEVLTINKPQISIDGNDPDFIDSTNKDNRYINIPTVYSKIDKKYLKLEDDQTCLAVNIFFEAANQLNSGQITQAETTVSRVGMFGDNNICQVVKHAYTSPDKKQLVLNKCHFSWYCEGIDNRVIGSDTKSMVAWNNANIIANETIKKYKAGKLKHKFDHYCTLKVERQTSWIPYMDKKTRTVIGDHVFYKADMKKVDDNWKNKQLLALNK
jgi:hypothetical protein